MLRKRGVEESLEIGALDPAEAATAQLQQARSGSILVAEALQHVMASMCLGWGTSIATQYCMVIFATRLICVVPGPSTAASGQAQCAVFLHRCC
jgi:hypothetical protein